MSKDLMFLLQIFFSSFILFSLPSYGGSCKEVFSQPIQQEILFNFSAADQSKTNNKHTSYKVRNGKAHSLSRKEIVQSFLELFYARDLKQIEALVLDHPFLKKQRFPIENSKIKTEHQVWMPQGWTPPQMAGYLKDIELLNLFLTLNFNIRTKKKQGGVSQEDNALHIAIKRNFPEGAESILKHIGISKFGKRNRFIDEKTHDKYTPWALAVQHYNKHKELNFIHLIGKYKPSGYVESYDRYEPKDGYKLALETRSRELIKLANEYLIAPKYEHYRDMKLNHPYPFQKRTQPFYYH